MDYSINVGDLAPIFKGIDQKGKQFTTSDELGKYFVIYFYPKDDTPGCTLQACNFRDNFAGLQKLSVDVIGISPDNIDSHKEFSNKFQLNFSLISDVNFEICRKYDVLRIKDVEGQSVQKMERTTFIIDPQGKILWIERPVNLEGHVERVLDQLNKARSQVL